MNVSIVKRIINLFLGFSFVGIFITMLSVSLSYIFLEILYFPLYLTYFGLYTFSILLSYYLKIKFVFKVKSNQLKLVKYLFVYLSGMIVGGVSLNVIDLNLNLTHWVKSILVLPITMVWNFSLSLVVLKD